MIRSKYTLFVEDYPETGKHMFFCTRNQAMVLVDEELREALSIGLIVGGSITIPHLRRAFQAWRDLDRAES